MFLFWGKECSFGLKPALRQTMDVILYIFIQKQVPLIKVRLASGVNMYRTECLYVSLDLNHTYSRKRPMELEHCSPNGEILCSLIEE